MVKRSHRKVISRPIYKRPIEQYEHTCKKRANNPPVRLVTPETDPDTGQKKTCQSDAQFDPQFVLAAEAEHINLEVPTVSLHVHERIEPGNHNGVAVTIIDNCGIESLKIVGVEK